MRSYTCSKNGNSINTDDIPAKLREAPADGCRVGKKSGAGEENRMAVGAVVRNEDEGSSLELGRIDNGSNVERDKGAGDGKGLAVGENVSKKGGGATLELG